MGTFLSIHKKSNSLRNHWIAGSSVSDDLQAIDTWKLPTSIGGDKICKSWLAASWWAIREAIVTIQSVAATAAITANTGGKVNRTLRPQPCCARIAIYMTQHSPTGRYENMFFGQISILQKERLRQRVLIPPECADDRHEPDK